MKLRIEVLKAPWPQGAKVGDVVEKDGIPAWAAGKCVQVADDTPVTLLDAEAAKKKAADDAAAKAAADAEAAKGKKNSKD